MRSREWRARGYMTIFREHPKGLIVILANKSSGEIRWAPVNGGEWLTVPTFEEFNEFDEHVQEAISLPEILWLHDNCKCDHRTCGACYKNREGVPDLNDEGDESNLPSP